MSYVIATPEMMSSAATDLATIGANVNAAHLIAAAPTVAVLPAAADEVSTGIAHLFSGYGQEYQKLAGEAAASHEQFVERLNASAAAYASAEAANVSLLTADAAASTPLLDQFIKFPILAFQLITGIFENPLLFFLFVLPIILIFGSLFLPIYILSLPNILFGVLSLGYPHDLIG
jgi:PE family protein